MQPRDPAEAARVVFTLTAVACLVTVVAAVLAPDAAAQLVQIAITIAVLMLLVAGGWLLRYGQGRRRLPWALFPLAGLLCIVALDLVTDDGSTAAQVFLLFPCLYASSQLRRPGAMGVTVAAVIADAVIVFSLLPGYAALVDVVYMAAAMGTSSELLVRAAERRELVLEQLHRHAAVDPLTGLVTRRVLETAAQTALSGATSRAGTALILLDVDRFKTINDAHGHLGGDEVLIQIAGILLNLSRPEDTVSRMGGDEIALLLPACPEPAAASRAEIIRSTIDAHVFVLGNGEELRASISAGIAHAPTHAVDLRSLYAHADASLYEAKRGGRNQVVAHPHPSVH